MSIKTIWKLFVLTNRQEKLLECFESYKLAKEALSYRYTLWYHLGSNPKFNYKIKKVIVNE